MPGLTPRPLRTPRQVEDSGVPKVEDSGVPKVEDSGVPKVEDSGVPNLFGGLSG
jgi:hypothetical protein